MVLMSGWIAADALDQDWKRQRGRLRGAISLALPTRACRSHHVSRLAGFFQTRPSTFEVHPCAAWGLRESVE